MRRDPKIEMITNAFFTISKIKNNEYYKRKVSNSQEIHLIIPQDDINNLIDYIEYLKEKK